MRSLRLLSLLACVLCLPGCQKDAPEAVVRPDLGISATFPGATAARTHEEDTPFGRMLWYDVIYVPRHSLAVSFHVEVGNLPPGTQGGNTPQAVMDTFRTWIDWRLEGRARFTPLPPDQGPGLRYETEGFPDRKVGGVMVVRRARIHHAQGTVSDPRDPRLAAFLDSFKVQ